MLTKEELSELKQKLESTKADLEKEIGTLDKVPEFGNDTDSFEEEADEAEEYGTNLGTQDALKKRLLNVFRALKKMNSGTYGACENCNQEMSIELLRIDPESRICRKCKEKARQ